MKHILFLFLAMTGVTVMGQNSETKISWEQGQHLTWDEFQGQPNASVSFQASTNSGISFSWSLKTEGADTQFVYEVGSYFYPDLSWVKMENESPHLLEHEQLHFDITELFARKLRRDMASYNIGPNIKADLNKIYKARERERREMQARFDRESNHGIEKEVQAKWLEFVRRELEENSKV